MKRLIVFLAVLVLICNAAYAEKIDYSTYSYDQLLELQAELEKEISNRESTDTGSFESKEDTKEYNISAYSYVLNDDGTASLTGFSWDDFNNGDDLIIPSTVNGHTISSINSHCFEGEKYKAIGTLMIPDGVNRIQSEAFWQLEANHIYIPSSVQKIEHGAFVVKFKTVSVERGSEDYTVVENALYEKSTKSLIAVATTGTSILNGIKNIGAYACYAVEPTDACLATIPDSVECIEAYAYYQAKIRMDSNSSESYKFTIPAQNLEEYAFSECIFWAKGYIGFELYFNDDLIEIPQGCFYAAATKIEKNVKYWNKSRFEYCREDALYNERCTIHLPSKLISIGDDAFHNFSTSLNVFTNDEYGTIILADGFPSGIESIGGHSFEKKGTIIVDSDVMFQENTMLKTIGDYAFNGATIELSKQSLVVLIPETLVYLGKQSLNFNSETGEHVIQLPASIEQIGLEAFNKENCVLEVEANSYAEKWAKEKAFRYNTLGNDSNDLSWL